MPALKAVGGCGNPAKDEDAELGLKVMNCWRLMAYLTDTNGGDATGQSY